MEKKINELLKEAVDELDQIKEGEIFMLRDLFKGYVWNRIGVSTRLRLGILFNEEAKTMNNAINVLKKNSANQQKYEKNKINGD